MKIVYRGGIIKGYLIVCENGDMMGLFPTWEIAQEVVRFFS